MDEVCRSKYRHANDEQTYKFVMQAADNHKNTFMNLLLPENEDTRQDVLENFRTIADEAKNKITCNEINFYEQTRNKSRHKYEEAIKKLWLAHRPSMNNTNEMISPSMLEIIQRRSEKIGERIDCIFKFQTKEL